VKSPLRVVYFYHVAIYLQTLCRSCGLFQQVKEAFATFLAVLSIGVLPLLGSVAAYNNLQDREEVFAVRLPAHYFCEYH